MSFITKSRSFTVKSSLRTVVWGSLVIFFYSSMAGATTFNGPTELYSKEFKDLNINGPSKLDGLKADSLKVNGPLKFTELKIKGKTEISGPCKGEDGEFENVVIHGPFEGRKIKANSLDVNGPVDIEDFKITGDVNINGPLKAKHGSFKDINAAHTPIQLYSVTVNNINVKKEDSKKVSTNNNDTNNEIKLAGDTIVSGNITFESGNGVVFIRDKTAQLKGKVIGGKIRE